ncbi:hypothetical protein G4B88_030181 [Cannabis sativa]|uniref:Uncharacterized protein n=1 Tax=Cannabis sativa TaxID=3483 RepID=A0A7J6EZ31_CANSA|nr:hypothetical protein G4B88_030181 [Cannabis sativa]
MHGREGEEGKRSRHMWTVPRRVVAVDGSSSSCSSSPNSFYKDGRKITVGDCALFKPPQDSPPFIGIIRWVTTGKDNKLKLGVNWLYRPAEVKLGKGILLDAAPNELFYSFHKDVIPAASLLHPCKVAFLPKGVELPSGISSFVCRQLYDITNKCLWWLTDQDYINERQEEVEQLLNKTRVEMHAGGRSPKPSNGPTSTSQLKAGSESNQNSLSSFSSQVRGKKRERIEQGSDSLKRERFTKTEDGDSGHCRQESFLKFEISKITEKGGLVDSEGVEKLVQLMLPDRNEKKIDLAGRSMLAGVIAATDKFDCLSRFVELRGLPVFDEWLQEIHKGKIGDSSGSKDGDKLIEEFLLVLLRALDKLPVNLDALKTCNIGKSVNHLRSHKNSEIQKKSRSLVDTWKKRVEAEMNINDVKPGSNHAVSWAGRSARLPEVGNRNSSGPSDVAVKSSVGQVFPSKSVSVKLVHGDSTTRSASASPGSVKSVPSPGSAGNNIKDGHFRNASGGMSDVPLTATRDEKSSSSSQSHNNSQSCSNDHARAGVVSGKDDARSSSAGSMNANKVSGGSSQPRKPINGLQGSLPGNQKETGSSKSSSLHKNPIDKSSNSGLTGDKMSERTTVDGNTHKLIVKIPNPGRSPARSGGGYFEDRSIRSSRASSPVTSEKADQLDSGLKEKSDACKVNAASDVNSESWQSNDFKDMLTASDEGDGSPAALTDEERCRTVDETKKVAEVSKTASSSSGNEHKSANLQEPSCTSMNALVESCVKFSEGNGSMSGSDDLGMNLLASVAAREMSKSDLVSPFDSPQRNNSVEPSSTGDDLKVKLLAEGELGQNKCLFTGGSNNENGKHASESDNLMAKGKEDKTAFLSDHTPTSEHTVRVGSPSKDFKQAEGIEDSKGKCNDVSLASPVISPSRVSDKAADREGGKPTGGKSVEGGVKTEGILDVKHNVSDPLLNENKITEAGTMNELKTENLGRLSPHSSLATDVKVNLKNEETDSIDKTDEKQAVSVMQSDLVNGACEVILPSDHGKDLVSEKACEIKSEKRDIMGIMPHVNESVNQRNEPEGNSLTTSENRAVGGVSSVTQQSSNSLEHDLKSKEVEQCGGGEQVSNILPSACDAHEAEQLLRSRDSKLTRMETNEAGECASKCAADVSSISSVGVSGSDAKVEFDLNEGFNADDGKIGDVKISAPGCSPTGHLISPLPFPVTSMSSPLPSSVTVTAAAKGPFLPPEDLLRSKGVLGWKGSAATSAFRPAEPRKVVDMPVGAVNISHAESTSGKQGRPPLDIDLNVPDERLLEDMTSRYSSHETSSTSNAMSKSGRACDQSTSAAPFRSSGGLDLDLNQADETLDMGSFTINNSRRTEIPSMLVNSSSRGTLAGDVGVRRDFDLNDGPSVDEMSSEPAHFIQQARSSVLSQPSVSGFRMNNTEAGNFSSWFHTGNNTYSAVTIPSVIPDRGEQPFPIVAAGGPQRMMGPPGGGNPFTPDVYRGSVLSASPAMPFPSTSFQYPVFSYGTSFSMPPSTFAGGPTTYLDSSSGGRVCFPAVHPQLLGTSAGGVSSNYPRPFVISLPDGSNNSSGESSRKWGRQGLDLNAGPGGPEIEGRDESFHLAPKQLSVASSQLPLDEQMRMFQMPGGTLKRKEPEGGWDGFKQSPWQQ